MALQEDLRAHLSSFGLSDTLFSMQLLFTEMASLWLVAPLDKGGFNLDRTSLTAAAVVSGMVCTLHYHAIITICYTVLCYDMLCYIAC